MKDLKSTLEEIETGRALLATYLNKSGDNINIMFKRVEAYFEEDESFLTVTGTMNQSWNISKITDKYITFYSTTPFDEIQYTKVHVEKIKLGVEEATI